MKNKIYFYRKEKSYALLELAKMVGILKSYLSRLENGERCNPSAVIIFKLSKILEADIDEITQELLK